MAYLSKQPMQDDPFKGERWSDRFNNKYLKSIVSFLEPDPQALVPIPTGSLLPRFAKKIDDLAMYNNVEDYQKKHDISDAWRALVDLEQDVAQTYGLKSFDIMAPVQMYDRPSNTAARILKSAGRQTNTPRQFLADFLDVFDEMPPELRGSNRYQLGTRGGEFDFNGYYERRNYGHNVPVPKGDGKIMISPFENFSDYTRNRKPTLDMILKHEAAHARTFEDDIPFELQKEFLRTGWSPMVTSIANTTVGTADGFNILKKNIPEDKLKKPDLLNKTTEYGATSPTEDLAEYLAIYNNTRLNNKFQHSNALKYMNNFYKNDYNRYEIVQEMMRQLERNSNYRNAL